MISEKKILESYKRITENHPKEFSTWRDLVKYLIETNPNQSEQRAYGEDYDEYWGKGIKQFKLFAQDWFEDDYWLDKDDDKAGIEDWDDSTFIPIIKVKEKDFKNIKKLSNGFQLNNKRVLPTNLSAFVLELKNNPGAYFHIVRDESHAPWISAKTFNSIDELIDSLYIGYLKNLYEGLVQLGITKEEIKNYGIFFTTESEAYPWEPEYSTPSNDREKQLKQLANSVLFDHYGTSEFADDNEQLKKKI